MLRWNLTNLWQKKKFLTTPLLFRTFSVIKHNTSNKINVNFLNFGWISSIQPKRTVKRGQDFRPNTYKRIKKHGRQTRMRTIDGRITIIRRMIKGVSLRNLTH